MKSKDFAGLAAEVSELLRDNGAVSAADAWQTFAGVFIVKPAANVSEICRSVPGVSRDLSQASNHRPRVQLIVQSIPALARLFAKIGKEALARDLRSIADAITPFADMDVSDFSARVTARLMQPVGRRKPGTDLELVDRYLESLEHTFRDEAAFKLAFASLKADKSAKAPEVKEIAKRFAGGSAENKKDALKFIWRRHESVMIDRAKDAATAGRTAA